jgi:hypothetical protein
MFTKKNGKLKLEDYTKTLDKRTRVIYMILKIF